MIEKPFKTPAFLSFLAASPGLPYLLLVIMGFLMLFNSLHKGLAYDEPNNLRYAHKFITEGPLAEPEGQRMPVLALNALGCKSYQCEWKILDGSERARLAVRLPSMMFALLTGWLIFIWVRQLYGRGPALAALALYVFNPNFVAHGKELTSDLATCFFVLFLMFSFWKFSQTKKRKWFFIASLASGGALLSKFSALLVFPAIALLLVPSFLRDAREKAMPAILKWAGGAALFGLLVLFHINAAYLFKGSFAPASQYSWQSSSYQKILGTTNLPVPFPKIFALGLDYTKYLEENPNLGRGNNYILGKLHRKGRWFSFPVMLGLKTPLAFFILIMLACFWKHSPKIPGLSAWLWLPFAAWFLIFSLVCEAQLGIRYILPALTFPLLFAARAFAGPLSAKRFYLLAALMIWYVVSSLSYGPHMLSYFNEVIGPRVNAYKYIADSNLDWEDKRYFTGRFIAEHPEMKITERPDKPMPGHLIVAANDLVGVLEEHRFEWLRKKFKPLQHIAYSHYLFYVPPDKLDAAVAEYPPS